MADASCSLLASKSILKITALHEGHVKLQGLMPKAAVQGFHLCLRLMASLHPALLESAVCVPLPNCKVPSCYLYCRFKYIREGKAESTASFP